MPVVAGIFDEPIDMWRGTMQAARSLQFAGADGGRNGYVIESAPGHPGLIALALPWEGADPHADLLGRIRHVAPLIAVTRDGGEGRVRLTRAGGVRIDYRLDASGVATLRHALVSMAGSPGPPGARRILAVGTPPRWHGACRLADPASESRRLRGLRGRAARLRLRAEPRHGRSRPTRWARPDGRRSGRSSVRPARARAGSASGAIVPGLYVADGSLFPTAIGVNPMVTIMALARRVARTVLAEGGVRG